MSDNLRSHAEITGDASKYVKATNEAIDATKELGESAEEASQDVEHLDESLSKVSGSQAGEALSEVADAAEALSQMFRLSKDEAAGLATELDSIAARAKSDIEAIGGLAPGHSDALRKQSQDYDKQFDLFNEQGRRLHELQVFQAQQREKTEDDFRQRELAALREHIQNKYEAETIDTAKFAQTRYALYDVSRTWGVVSAATLGAATAVQTVASNYEYAFSAVQRVTQTAGEEAATMKQDLKDLASTIHEEFDSIAQVATLGGQMGVASDEIKEFTRNVTMFGATTNATVQEAATGFGRIAQMTKAGHDAWENIGSAIYQVGINSVATESQILNVAQEIATAGNLAGFTTDEVIGLSGALASLNIKPERARGNILRFFSEIDKAIAEGGDGLDQYAKTAQMSADEFAAAWKDTPELAFRALLEGMKAAADEGQNLGQVIRDLGVNNVRDVQTYQQLANNVDLYVASMGHANEAYREGTALADAYGIRSDTVIGKLQILRNVIANILDALGSNQVVKWFLDALTGFGRVVEGILKLPLAAWIGTSTVAIVGMIGVVAAFRAAFAAMQASVLGLELAMVNLGKLGRTVDLSFTGMIASLGRFSAANKKAAADVNATTVALNNQAVAAGRMSRMWSGVTATASRAGGALGTVFGFLKGFGPALAITGGLMAIGKGIEYISERSKSATDHANEMFGSLSSLSTAIDLDTKEFEETGEALRTLVVETENGEVVWDSATDSQKELGEAISGTTEEIETQTIAIGRNYAENLKSVLLGNEDLVDSWHLIKDAADMAGISQEDMFKKLASGESISPIIQKSVDLLKQERQELIDINIARLDEIQILESREALYGELSRADQEDLDRRRKEQEDARVRIDYLDQEVKAMEGLIPALQGVSDETDKFVRTVAMGNELDSILNLVDPEDAGEAEEGVSKLTGRLQEMFDILEDAHDSESTLRDLTTTLLENGTAIDEMTAEGMASFGALNKVMQQFAEEADGDMQMFSMSLAEMMAYLEGAGIAVGDEMGYLYDHLQSVFHNEWGLDVNTSFARSSIQAFMQDAVAAIQLRAQLERDQLMANARVNPLTGATNIDAQLADINRVETSQIRAIESFMSGLSRVEEQGRKAANTFYNPPGRKSGGGRKSPIGKDAKEAQDEVRTLTDYVKDLTSVASDAFNFRFGLTISTDELEAVKRSLKDMKADALQRVADAFDSLSDARQRVTDLRISIQDLEASITGLGAEQSKLQYFYEIAVEYGDTARAEQLSAQLAKVQADLAKAENDRAKEQAALAKGQEDVTKKTEDLSQAQSDSKRTLTENTESSAAQRKAVMDLVQAYQAQIIELINAGASQSEIERNSKALQKEFEQELRQLGYNTAEVGKYSKSFQDLSKIIKNIPAANVKANTDPAVRAINDFVNKKRSTTVQVKATTPKIGSVSGGPYRPSSVSVGNGGMFTPNLSVGGKISGKAGALAALSRDVGGYTGSGGQYAVAGNYHYGEYIFPKNAVNQNTGLPHADVMARMMVGTREFNSLMSQYAAPQRSGVQGAVSLTAGTIQAIAQAVQPFLVVNNKVIAQANGSDAQHATNAGRL